MSFRYDNETNPVWHDPSGYWPSDGPVGYADLRVPGGTLDRGLLSQLESWVTAPMWRLQMYASGHLVIRRGDEPDDDGTIPVAWSEELEPLKRAFVFCKMGYDQDRDMSWNWQDGTPYIFNWVTGTIYQLSLARRILALFLAGRVNEAWDVGKMAEDLVRVTEENERQNQANLATTGALLAHDDPRMATQRQRHIRHLPECPAYDPPYNDDAAECQCRDISPEWDGD